MRSIEGLSDIMVGGIGIALADFPLAVIHFTSYQKKCSK